MADVGLALKIKYGLRNNASPEQIRRWEEQVRSLIGRGQSPEAAGAIAAKSIFPDYRVAVYASEADTIEALLLAAGGKK